MQGRAAPGETALHPWIGNPGYLGGHQQTIDLKIEALRKHASQLGDWDVEEEIRKWAAEEEGGEDLAYSIIQGNAIGKGRETRVIKSDGLASRPIRNPTS
jgi:hypothetical protein